MQINKINSPVFGRCTIDDTIYLLEENSATQTKKISFGEKLLTLFRLKK